MCEYVPTSSTHTFSATCNLQICMRRTQRCSSASAASGVTRTRTLRARVRETHYCLVTQMCCLHSGFRHPFFLVSQFFFANTITHLTVSLRAMHASGAYYSSTTLLPRKKIGKPTRKGMNARGVAHIEAAPRSGRRT